VMECVGEYNILVNFPLINGLGVVFFLQVRYFV
jgi:hypothetical protein